MSSVHALVFPVARYLSTLRSIILAMLSYAIEASESNDRRKRKIAAIILSHIGTREAAADLKELAADSDPGVKEIAKAFSAGEDDSYYSRLTERPVKWLPIHKHHHHQSIVQ